MFGSGDTLRFFLRQNDKNHSFGSYFQKSKQLHYYSLFILSIVHQKAINWSLADISPATGIVQVGDSMTCQQALGAGTPHT